MAKGFDDIEMRNRNIEEEEEERKNEEEETSFNNDDEHNRSINIINTSNSKSKYSRVDYRKYIPDINKDVRSIRKSLTNDRRNLSKKIFNVNLEKKNGPNSSILLDDTVFVRSEKTENIFIEFEGKRIGNVNKNLEPELFIKKKKIC